MDMKFKQKMVPRQEKSLAELWSGATCDLATGVR
jgi:hypothetical protein